MQRRVIVLTLTADPNELRYMASCIDVGNENDEEVPASHQNQADALSSKLNRIADAIESGRHENGDFILPFIQVGVAQGAESVDISPDDIEATQALVASLPKA